MSEMAISSTLFIASIHQCKVGLKKKKKKQRYHLIVTWFIFDVTPVLVSLPPTSLYPKYENSNLMCYLLFTYRGLSLSRISLPSLREDVRERRGRESQYQPEHQRKINHWVQSTGFAPAACQPVSQQVPCCKASSVVTKEQYFWGGVKSTILRSTQSDIRLRMHDASLEYCLR